MTEQEFEKLYQDAYKAVYWTAFSLLKNEDEAEDVVQDTFVTAYNSYDSLREKDKAVAWVKKIAANKCLNILTRRRTFNVEDEIFENTEAAPEDFLPASLVESGEKRKIIMDIINKALSENARMTIILFYFNEMSVKEIAEKLGIPQGTVLSRLDYAKKKIKKEVEKYEKDNNDKLFAMGVPFLTLLFEKEAQQVPFRPMPPLLKTIPASGSSSATASSGGSKIAATAAKSAKATLLPKIAIGVAAVTALGGTGLIVGNLAKSKDSSSAIKTEIAETYEATKVPMNVLGMTPDQLDLSGGYIRHEYITTSNGVTSEGDSFYYDSDGRLILDCLYNENGELEYSYYYIYDDEGFLIREEHWDRDADTLGTYTDYTYGPHGIERAEQGDFEADADHYIIYEYDDQGRLMGETSYMYSNNKTYWYSLYEYDTDGSYTITEYEWDVHDQEIRQKNFYEKYGSDGQLVERFLYDYLTLYEYDADDLLINAEVYSGNTLVRSINYEYEDIV